MMMEFRVADATCGHCNATIEQAVAGLQGVVGVDLDLDSKRMRVEHTDAIGSSAIESAIIAAGYTPKIA